ncbi:MAG: TA system VapC family ribonuclease toxin [Deinococcales bacterium]
MIYLLDVNILIYTFRQDSDFHTPCYQWLVGILSKGHQIIIPDINKVAFIRLSTLPSLGDKAATLNDVFTFLSALLKLKNSKQVFATKETYEQWHKLCQAYSLRGNHCNDAYLAALSLEYQAILVSADKGFARFNEITWLNPLHAKTA